MRTTVNIDDDVLDEVRRRAEARQRSVGEVLSEAARRGLREPSVGVRETHDGVPVFDVADDAPAVDEAAVVAALDEFP